MTPAHDPAVRSQTPEAWRLLAAVAFVLAVTAFTVQAFVASTPSAAPAAPEPLGPRAERCAGSCPGQARAWPLEVTDAGCAVGLPVCGDEAPSGRG